MRFSFEDRHIRLGSRDFSAKIRPIQKETNPGTN